MDDNTKRRIADAEAVRAVEEWVRIRMALGSPVPPSVLEELFHAGLIGSTLQVQATHHAWTWLDRQKETT